MTTQYTPARISAPEFPKNPLAELNRLIRDHTGFTGMVDLAKSSRYSYRPTLNCSQTGNIRYSAKKDAAELSIIADCYDRMMERLGSNKRAYRI
ncbi:MAG: hypothetical protein KJ725_14375 [Gammaproteobacteria bacterium]|nr:hypothetical protein [Gammaproteobacteria bacterium]